MAKWLSKYEQGGLVLKQKTKDNYGKKPNPNNVQASVGPDFVGMGNNTKGRNYSPAWGGQFQDGGTLSEKVLLHDPKPLGDHQYSLKKTVTPYKTNQQIKKNTKAPINPDDVDFLYNYRHVGGEGSDYRNKTAVPTEGDKHWNIAKFIVDPQFGDAYEELSDVDNSTEAERRNVLADMFKYQMLQHPEQSRGKSFRQAKRFVRNEIDPIVNGPFLQFYTDKDKYQPYSDKFLDTFANSNPFIISSSNSTNPMSDDETEKVSTDYLRNIKKLSRKETKEQIKNWKTEAKSFLESISKPTPQIGVGPMAEYAMGGSIPGAVGFTYARTAGAAPSNGKYAKKTKASAQNGKVLDPNADDRTTLDFNNPDPAFQYVRANSFVPFDTKNFEGIKQNIARYMNSPLYMERLSKSIPDQELAKDVQQQRLDNLLSIKLNPNTVDRGTDYNMITNRVNLGASDFVDNPSIAHEVAHGIIPNRTLSYGKQNLLSRAANVVGDLFQPFEQFSKSELEKINIPLSGRVTAPNEAYQKAIQEEHYKPQGSRASAKTAANETYGDLTGMRQLLLDNGITTEFGQELTPEMFQKALKNPKINNQPGMQRMRLKFKDEDIIKMNNEVAQLNNTAPLTQAQNGKEMRFYQQGLDFTPKNISKNGSVIKDDMGQWAHPGEITEINSNDITMEGVDYPVLGISDTGDTKLMQPGENYKFKGKKVTEFPMMKNGGWLDKYKAQDGENIPEGMTLPTVTVTSSKPSMWGKFDPAQYEQNNRETLSQWNPKPGEIEAMTAAEKARKDEEDSWYNNRRIKSLRNSAFADWRPYAIAGGITAAPAISSALGLGSTATALATPMAGVPGLTGANVLNAIFAYQGLKNLPNVASSIETAYTDPTLSNIGNAALETGVTALDILPFAATVTPEIKAAINASKESGLLSKASELNPWAWSPEETSAYRMIGGEAGLEDLIASGKVRPSVKGSDIGKVHDQAFYSIGAPSNAVTYNKYRKTFGRAYPGPYMVEAPTFAKNPAFQYGIGGNQVGAQTWTNPGSHLNMNDVNVYKKHWLKGQELMKSKIAEGAAENTSTTMLDKVLGKSKYRDRVFAATKNLYDQIVGRYMRDEENKAAIAEGNEWLKNWIQSEATKDKLANRARSISYSFSQHPDIISKIETLQNFTPNVSEYPIKGSLDDFLGILMGNKEKMVHQGNIGVAYRHSLNPFFDEPKFRIGDPSSGPGTWMNRAINISSPQRTSSTIHEGVHDWFRHEPLETFGYSDLIKSSVSENALDQYHVWLNSKIKDHGLGYYANPTEVHARIMQMRHQFGLTPETYVTPKMAEDMLKIVEQGNTPVKWQFPSIFDNYEKVANLFNKLPAALPAVAIGAGALGEDSKEKKKNGGWLDKHTPKAQTGITTSIGSGTINPTVQLTTQEDIKKVKKKADDDTKAAFAAAAKRDKKNQAYISKDKSTPASRAADEQMLTDAYMAEAQRNSPLAQTFGSLTPSGYNPGAGAVAANQFVKTTPLILAGGVGATAMPSIVAGLNAPMAGVPGLTGANILNAGFAYQGLKHVPGVAEDWKTAVNDPSFGSIGTALLNTGLTTLDVLPFASEVTKGAKYLKKLNNAANISKETPVINDMGEIINAAPIEESASKHLYNPVTGQTLQYDASGNVISSSKKLTDAEIRAHNRNMVGTFKTGYTPPPPEGMEPYLLTDDALTPSWQQQELPGLHLSSTIEGGPISKIIEPKTGLINVEQALGIIGKESGGASKVDLIKKALGDELPKKMDYNEFRKVVQDQLIPLERNFTMQRSNFGIDNLGFNKKVGMLGNTTREAAGAEIERIKEIIRTEEGVLGEEERVQQLKKILDRDIKDYNNLPLENQTLLLSNKEKFGRGSGAHNNPEETLGHIHFLRDADTPDILTVTQLQSDAFQSTNREVPRSLEAAQSSITKLKEEIIENKKLGTKTEQASKF